MEETNSGFDGGEDITVSENSEEDCIEVELYYNQFSSKFCAVLWQICIKYKQQLINTVFLVMFFNPNGGEIVFTCVKDNVIVGKEQYK